MKTMTRVILASQSPRRRDILSNKFKYLNIIDIDGAFEPRWAKGQDPDNYLAECLRYKANQVEEKLIQNPSQLISATSSVVFAVVADTIVQLGKTVFGKPKNAKDAHFILSQLSGKTHFVKTGVSTLVLNHELKRIDHFQFVSLSEVEFKKISSTEIQSYIKTREPFDKAGAYGLQDKALKFVKSIRGSYLNIVGFPLLDFEKKIESYLNVAVQKETV
jgi:MAF protein